MNKSNKCLKQYNAAIKYIERNSFRIKRFDSIFFLSVAGIILYFIGLYLFKIISCIR